MVQAKEYKIIYNILDNIERRIIKSFPEPPKYFVILKDDIYQTCQVNFVYCKSIFFTSDIIFKNDFKKILDLLLETLEDINNNIPVVDSCYYVSRTRVSVVVNITNPILRGGKYDQNIKL